ncbi:hypothetical protein H4Q26_004421 [Puccinia striiformis f. sp. tritici PST-130]|nr:hypothetical protein H4Q26_004421 [Puccinia striiformis f. sp. tritici PST-130]
MPFETEADIDTPLKHPNDRDLDAFYLITQCNSPLTLIIMSDLSTADLLDFAGAAGSQLLWVDPHSLFYYLQPAFLDPNRLERLTHRKVPSHKSPDNLSREQNQASS